MARSLSEIKKLAIVPQVISSGTIQARKRIQRGDPYQGIKTGQVFEIYDFEPVSLDNWICTCRDMEGHWYSIPEKFFDWDKDSFEISIGEARAELTGDYQRIKALERKRNGNKNNMRQMRQGV